MYVAACLAVLLTPFRFCGCEGARHAFGCGELGGEDFTKVCGADGDATEPGVGKKRGSRKMYLTSRSITILQLLYQLILISISQS